MAVFRAESAGCLAVCLACFLNRNDVNSNEDQKSSQSLHYPQEYFCSVSLAIK